MTKLIFKLFQYFSRLAENRNMALWEPIIVALYKKVRLKEGFVVHIEEIPVKKGKVRYTLVVVETPTGQIKYNLGRYDSNFVFDEDAIVKKITGAIFNKKLSELDAALS